MPPQKLNIEFHFYIGIPCLGIYAEEFKIGTQIDICIPKFIGALFIIAKRWKQATSLSMNGQVNKMWHTYNTILFILERTKILTHVIE